MAIFQTKITRARLTVSPFSSEQMLTIGNALMTSIKTRIQSGLNISDSPAKPLKGVTHGAYIPYARQKERHGIAGLRNWTWTGRTLRSMKVLSVSENAGKIGFTDSKSDQVAHINNLREKAFGVSPNDRLVLQKAVFDIFKTGKIIQFRKVA